MKQRCLDPNHKSWSDYGGRGIRISDRWLGERGFEHFLADMGERPPGTTLDRYPEKDGDYEPGNTRWATRAEQAQNRRSTKLTEYDVDEIRFLVGHGFTCVEIARSFGVSDTTVSAIVRGKIWGPRLTGPAAPEEAIDKEVLRKRLRDRKLGLIASVKHGRAR